MISVKDDYEEFFDDFKERVENFKKLVLEKEVCVVFLDNVKINFEVDFKMEVLKRKEF